MFSLIFWAKIKNYISKFQSFNFCNKRQIQSRQTIVWVGIANFLHYINLFFDILYMPTSCLFILPLPLKPSPTSFLQVTKLSATW